MFSPNEFKFILPGIHNNTHRNLNHLDQNEDLLLGKDDTLRAERNEFN